MLFEPYVKLERHLSFSHRIATMLLYAATAETAAIAKEGRWLIAMLSG